MIALTDTASDDLELAAGRSRLPVSDTQQASCDVALFCLEQSKNIGKRSTNTRSASDGVRIAASPNMVPRIGVRAVQVIEAIGTPTVASAGTW